MSCNVMNEYIKLTQKEINSYMKLIFDNKFNKKICDGFIEAYMKVRYYNYEMPNSENTFRKKILESIDLEMEKLIKEIPDKEKVIRQIHAFCPFMLYFDNVTYYRNIKRILERIEDARKKILEKENDKTFKREFLKIVKENARIKADFLKKFETEDFSLKLTPYSEMHNVYKANIKYNFKFPKIYSEDIIEKAFNEGIINEDKLLIEYYLMAVHIIKDTVKGNFKKQYICEFTNTIFDKKQKLANLLNIIDNAAIQDRLSILIEYKDYLKRKNEIIALMKRGFRFAVVMDEKFEINYKNMEKLNMFNFILISKEQKYYKEFMSDKVMLHNVIDIG